MSELRALPPSKRVLVIEDDANIRESVSTLLREEGYVVLAVPTAEAGLDLLHLGTHPDLILLDLVMPGVGGFGFLKEVKSDARLSAIPVVVMSAHCDPSGVSRILNLAGSLTKPFRVETLLETLAASAA